MVRHQRFMLEAEILTFQKARQRERLDDDRFRSGGNKKEQICCVLACVKEVGILDS